MPVAPAWAAAFSKLHRKLFVERSGRSEARFGTRWFAFDGRWAPDRWGDGIVVEKREIMIPRGMMAGEYRLQPTVHEAPWRSRLDLRDYLRDDDRYSGPTAGRLELRPRATP